jgi:hypothetical protein
VFNHRSVTMPVFPSPTFAEACEQACVRSLKYGCTVHVNCYVVLYNGEPAIGGFRCDDWYSSDSTVATYSNGKEH